MVQKFWSLLNSGYGKSELYQICKKMSFYKVCIPIELFQKFSENL
jgi:hypothetical protein